MFWFHRYISLAAFMPSHIFYQLDDQMCQVIPYHVIFLIYYKQQQKNLLLKIICIIKLQQSCWLINFSIYLKIKEEIKHFQTYNILWQFCRRKKAVDNAFAPTSNPPSEHNCNHHLTIHSSYILPSWSSVWFSKGVFFIIPCVDVYEKHQHHLNSFIMKTLFSPIHCDHHHHHDHQVSSSSSRASMCMRRLTWELPLMRFPHKRFLWFDDRELDEDRD